MTVELSAFHSFLRHSYREHVGGRAGRVPEAVEIGRGGSPRRFWRIGEFPQSLVGMYHPTPPCNPAGVSENDAFLYVQRHLEACGIDVPRLLALDLARGWFAMEDLGERLLYNELLQAGPGGETGDWLAEAVRQLVKIHVRASHGFVTEKTHNEDYTSGFARLRESGYFQKNFLEEEIGMDPRPLDAELDELAARLDHFWTPHFLYRDFQSQNIAIKEGRLHFFDFQGARRGPRQYDLASLVYDPYLELPAGLQQGLLAVYLDTAAAEGPFDRDMFLAGFPLVAAHRLMQALGAYGYLARHMKKHHFRQHIPAAVRLLGRLLDEYPELNRPPRFSRLVRSLERRVGQITAGARSGDHAPGDPGQA
jgi:aminoglycoside/choline kinase family phosphotransferase